MKIALIGSAPSSVDLAPWTDSSWTIWACSPGAWPHVKRCEAFFEIHRWQPGAPWFSAEYIAFLKAINGPVYMIRPVPELPNSVAYPKDEMLARFGPFFFGSSLSWMFALAIASGATEIGLWGVDMSATEEWGGQRAGCHFFIHTAKSLGIKVTIPGESDLLRPEPLYGFCEEEPMFIKAQARVAELTGRFHDAVRREQQAHDERMFLQGALDDVTYVKKTWIADRMAIDMAYSQPLAAMDIPAAPEAAPIEEAKPICPPVLNGKKNGSQRAPREDQEPIA